jgi:plastocyanin
MQNTVSATVLAFAVSALQSTAAQQTEPQSRTVASITIVLSNFAFEPDHILLKVGIPVRLHLVNECSGGHSFAAPGFFAASSPERGFSIPSNGAVEVASHQQVDIVVVPHAPGQYRLECTHFLHSVFGMHGTIEVGQ